MSLGLGLHWLRTGLFWVWFEEGWVWYTGGWVVIFANGLGSVYSLVWVMVWDWPTYFLDLWMFSACVYICLWSKSLVLVWSGLVWSGLGLVWVRDGAAAIPHHKPNFRAVGSPSYQEKRDNLLPLFPDPIISLQHKNFSSPSSSYLLLEVRAPVALPCTHTHTYTYTCNFLSVPGLLLLFLHLFSLPL